MGTDLSFEYVEGTLTSEGGRKYRIKLRLAIRSLSGQSGVEDQAVARRELTERIDAPDGNYTLEYFYMGSQRFKVRVQDGFLLSPP